MKITSLTLSVLVTILVISSCKKDSTGLVPTGRDTNELLK